MTLNNTTTSTSSSSSFGQMVSKWLGHAPQPVADDLIKKATKDSCSDTLSTTSTQPEDVEELEEERRAQILALASVFPPNCHKQVRQTHRETLHTHRPRNSYSRRP